MDSLTLPKMDFPLEEIQTTALFADERLLAPLHGQCHPEAYLPKVEQAFFKLMMPTGKRVPYVYSSIAFSADGKFAYPDNTDGDMLVHSHSKNAQGAMSDYFLLNMMRAYADAVMIGTKTMAAEANAFPTILDPQLLAERQVHFPNKKEQPFPIVASKDGSDIPFEHVLFHQDLIPVLIFTSPTGLETLQPHMGTTCYHLEQFDVDALYQNRGKCAVMAVGEGDMPDMEGFLSQLKAGGVDHVFNESPTLMWRMMSQGLLNEFFITYAMVFIGGDFTLGLHAPKEFNNHPESALANIAIHNNQFLFTRQLLAPPQ